MNVNPDYRSDARAVPFDNMEQPLGGRSLQIPLADKTVNTEVSGDFSLPDYQPEIKRLLKIGTAVHPPVRYAGSGEVDISGGMDYFVFYTGNDNRLYCAPLNTDYRLTVPLNDDAGMESVTPSICLCQSTVDSAVGRVTAPRRLNIRCRLRSRVQVFGERAVDVGETGLATGSIETLQGERSVGLLWEADGDPIILQDDVIPDMRSGLVRVVCTEGQVMVTEASAGMGVLNCRGEVTMKLTLCPLEADEDGMTLPVVLTRKIPFSESIEMPDVTPDCQGCAYGVCSDISAEMEEGRIHLEAAVLLHAMAQKNQSVSYVKDLYSTRQLCDCRYTDLPVHRAVRCVGGNVTQSESLPLNETGIDPTAQVLDVSGTAYPDEVTVYPDQDRCVMSGKCRYQLLLLRDGEYAGAEIELPFRYEIEGVPDENAEFYGNVTVVTCRARMDSERVGVDAELSVSGRMYLPESVTLPTVVTPQAELSRRCGEYAICFPTSDDSLWSVAKRYHAPLSVLAAANSIPSGAPIDSPESIAGNHYLIV